MNNDLNDLHAFFIIRNEKVIGYLSMEASFQDVSNLIKAGYNVMPNKSHTDSVAIRIPIPTK